MNDDNYEIKYINTDEIYIHPNGSKWILFGLDNELPKIKYYNLYRYSYDDGPNLSIKFFQENDKNVVKQLGYGRMEFVLKREDMIDALNAHHFKKVN
jgi:hypothetical protein